VSISSLCRGLPEELRKYLEYTRSLRFEDKPNYMYLKGLFREALETHKYGDPATGFDWMRMKGATGGSPPPGATEVGAGGPGSTGSPGAAVPMAVKSDGDDGEHDAVGAGGGSDFEP